MTDIQSKTGSVLKRLRVGNELAIRFDALEELKKNKTRPKNTLTILHGIMLNRDENFNLRISIIHYLGEIKSGTTIDSLIKLVENSNEWMLRLEAIKVMCFIGKRSDIVIPFLLSELENEIVPYVRHWIPIYLSRFGIKAIQPIKTIITRHQDLRKLSLWSLSKIKDNNNEIRDYLYEELLRSRDIDDKYAIAIALYRVEGLNGKGEEVLFEMKQNKELNNFQEELLHLTEIKQQKQTDIIKQMKSKPESEISDFKEKQFEKTFSDIERNINFRALESIQSILTSNEESKKFDVEKLEIRNFSDLVKFHEHDQLEFKPSFVTNPNIKNSARNLEFENIKTIAGFLNAVGGILLIGVTDKGDICGLSNDYKLLNGKQNKDGFQLMLNQKIKEKIGIKAISLIKIYIEEINQKEFCIITVQKSPHPIFIKRKSNQPSTFFVRFGNSTISLDVEQYDEYRKTHWQDNLK